MKIRMQGTPGIGRCHDILFRQHVGGFNQEFTLMRTLDQIEDLEMEFIDIVKQLSEYRKDQESKTIDESNI